MQRIATLVLALGLTACGNGNGGDTAEAPTYDATGSWTVFSFNGFSSLPGDEEEDSTVPVEIGQTGNSVTVDTGEVVYSGRVSGAAYTVSARYPDDDGFTDETIQFTLGSADSGNGTARWTFTNGETITGGSDLTFTRVP